MANAQQPRQYGLGISVGPWLQDRPDLLNEMRMQWVKVYLVEQAANYPDQKALYRIDMRGAPADLNGWEQEMRNWATMLSDSGIEAVEIGNEPNLTKEWGNNVPDAQAFTEALCISYRVFKEVAPQITVVSGGLAATGGTEDGLNVDDLDYLRAMLNAGAGNCFDAFGYHPYGYNQPPEANPYQHELSFRRAERAHIILSNYNVDAPMWITEFGWVRNPAEGGLDCSGSPDFAGFEWMAVSAQTQADYTARAVTYAERNWPWVGPMFLWNLNWNVYPGDYAPAPVCSHLRWYGILDRNGQPLPVVDALRNRPEVSLPTPTIAWPTLTATPIPPTTTATATLAPPTVVPVTWTPTPIPPTATATAIPPTLTPTLTPIQVEPLHTEPQGNAGTFFQDLLCAILPRICER